ncbi:putative O-sialoglyco protein endopeptidase [Pseudovirgaria hyperparasitica]|uniref:Putative O-sialoglyco protein endopeptidase n=1 Tax=Pseudovirgaria hyperparasitica TaxID=470096 RepID=A0A6A6W319_9PEZI|nr:putative O-sialoglyco protein endopeptidase [Pseudovirgaria hyperparasitica]KAF2756414.1 putative O-sialoglyco protein endopeptidase [Pseudovirgaria hyperparasitica]
MYTRTAPWKSLRGLLLTSRHPCPRLNTTLHTLRSSLCTLAIETSCDDTSVAVLEYKSDPRDPVLRQGSQAKLRYHKTLTSRNKPYGGIHPVVALESHQENLAILVREALRSLPDAAHDESTSVRSISVRCESRENTNKVIPDFISVTRGPGMRSNLNTGLDLAKGLAVAWDVPLIGVHHMHAHALTPRFLSASDVLGSRQDDTEVLPEVAPAFPFLSLLVSGGHTLLIQTNSLTEHRVLATTMDIAIGVCLDKIARAVLPEQVLNSSPNTMYGAVLERFAFANGAEDHAYEPPGGLYGPTVPKPSQYGWTIPAPFNKINAQSIERHKANNNEFAFSFTGLTTSIERIVDTLKLKSPCTSEEDEVQERRALAREAMQAVFEHVGQRIVLALRDTQKENPELASRLQTLVVSGGVAANKYLRCILSPYLAARGYADMSFVYPPVEYCTDNAAMIAWAGMEMFTAGHTTSLAARSIRKWPIDAILDPPST